MNLDRALTPSDYDMDKAYDSAEREAEYIEKLKNRYIPEEIFGKDVYQNACIYYLKWVFLKGWQYFCGQWWNWEYDLPLSDEQLYQLYLKDTNK